MLHAVDGFAETFYSDPQLMMEVINSFLVEICTQSNEFDEQADDCAEEKLRAHLDTERAAEVKGLRDEAGILECCDPCQCSCLRLVGQPQNMG